MVALGGFRNPPGWPALQNPASHLKSYGFTELGRLVLIAPFILARHIRTTHIHNNAYNLLVKFAADSTTITAGSNKTGLDYMTRVFVDLANHVTLSLQDTFSEDQYNILGSGALATRRSFQKMVQCYPKKKKKNKKGKLAPHQAAADGDSTTCDASNSEDSINVAESLAKLPNVHVGLHLEETARRYGTLNNVNSTMGEERHKITKRDVLHISLSHEPVRQLMVKMNVTQTLELLSSNTFAQERPFITNFLHEVQQDCPKLYRSVVTVNAPMHSALLRPSSGSAKFRDVDGLDSVKLHAPMTLEEAQRQGLASNHSGNVLRGVLTAIITAELGVPLYDIGVVKPIYGKKASFIGKTGERCHIGVDGAFRIPGILYHQKALRTTLTM